MDRWLGFLKRQTYIYIYTFQIWLQISISMPFFRPKCHPIHPIRYRMKPPQEELLRGAKTLKILPRAKTRGVLKILPRAKKSSAKTPQELLRSRIWNQETKEEKKPSPHPPRQPPPAHMLPGAAATAADDVPTRMTTTWHCFVCYYLRKGAPGKNLF